MTEPALDQIDADVRRQSFAAMGSQIRLLDDLILHINHGKSKLTKQKRDHGVNFLVGLLMSRAFNSLWRAREDAVCGYYPEALTLCRSVFEHWLTAKWVAMHEDRADQWLHSFVDEVETPALVGIPAVKTMLDEVDPDGISLEAYGVLSLFVHPRGTGLRWLIHFDEEATYFHVGGFFDKFGLRRSLYFLISYAQACLNPTGALMERMLGVLDEEWFKRAVDLTKQAQDFTDSVIEEVVEAGKRLDFSSDVQESSGDLQS